MTINKKYQNIVAAFIFLAFSFGLLYICTSSSPRYATNPWVDSNAFMTVGKSMVKGLVPYKDLFEQKGPLLYLIHGISYLVFENNFTGVYVFESISMALTLLFVLKTVKLFLNTASSYLVSVLTGIVTANAFCFYLGDSAEEFCLPLLSVAIYYLCLYFKDNANRNLQWYTYLFCGICAGCIAMIKFNVLGIWFAWMASLSLHTLFVKKEVKSAFLNAFIFIIGMALPVIPWIIYFTLNGALKDFLDVYIFINTKFYSTDTTFSIVTFISNYFTRFLHGVLSSKLFSAITFISLWVLLFSKKVISEKIPQRLPFLFAFIFNALGIYLGTSISYYHLPFAVFIPFAFIGFVMLAEQLIKKPELFNKIISSLLVILIIAALPISLTLSLSSRRTEKNFQKTVQYEFCEYIKSEKPDSKILNLGFLDGGFYLAADQVPAFVHFEQQNIPREKFSLNYDEQERYVKEGLADFVVARERVGSQKTVNKLYPFIFENYRLVKKTECSPIVNVSREENSFIFYLFEKKNA